MSPRTVRPDRPDAATTPRARFAGAAGAPYSDPVPAPTTTSRRGSRSQLARQFRRASSVGALVAVMVLGGQPVAHAAPQGRPDPEPTGSAGHSGYALATLQQDDGHSIALRWNPCRPITYRINTGGLPAKERPAFAAQVRRALTSLAAATGLTYRDLGSTSYVPRRADTSAPADLVIAATDQRHTDYPIGDRMVGYGGYQYWQWPDRDGRPAAAISRGWVVIDSATFRRLPAGFGPGVRQGNVLMHELAHTVGLEHVDDARQLMNAELTAGSPNGWAAGDRRGLALLGPGGGGCITLPATVAGNRS